MSFNSKIAEIEKEIDKINKFIDSVDYNGDEELREEIALLRELIK